MKKVVVLGGSGFMGRNICQYLAECGYDVTSITHQAADSAANNKYKEIAFDLMKDKNVFFLLHQVKACDVCILLSWIGTRDRNCLDINMESANMLLVVFRAFAEMFPKAMYIQAGSAAEYGRHDNEIVKEDSVCEPFLPYGKGKLSFYKAASAFSRLNNINFIELRFHSVFGMENNERKILIRVISSFVRGERVIMKNNCNQLWNFISVHNVCYAIHKVIQRGRLQEDVYNIGSNDVKSLKQYLMQLAELCDVDQTMICFGNKMDGMSYNFQFDSSRLQEELEWNPIDDFKQEVRLIKANIKMKLDAMDE